MMTAVTLSRYGGPEVLSVAELPIPTPKPGQLLVRVRAAGVNPRDWLIREGRYVFKAALPKFPFVLGSDLAGDVVQLGAGVKAWKVGDRVFGMQPLLGGMGAYAQYAAIDAEAVASMPDNACYEDCAALPCAGLTAWGALLRIGKLPLASPDSAGATLPRPRVLIHGASGGVGSYAVQLARACNAQVIGVGRAGNEAFVRTLGADAYIDYQQQPVWKAAQATDLDVFFDAAGRAGYAHVRPCLRSGGRYITTVPGAQAFKDSLTSHLRRCVQPSVATSAHTVLVRAFGADLAQMAGLMATGRLRSEIDEVFALADVGAAHARSRSWHTRGKLVLQIP